MNTAPNSITGRGYVLAAYGNPAGDMNPTYDIVLATPPDLAGKKFFAVANDNRLAVNAKVRPAAVNSPVEVTWTNGERFVDVRGEPIVFAGCGTGAGSTTQTKMEMIETPINKGGALAVGDSGGSPIGPTSPPGGV